MIKEAVRLAGRRVLDVGCGDGALAAWMQKQGADVLGLEAETAQLERARHTLGTAAAIEGRAEALPLADGSRELILYFNSFHHIPVEAMGRALDEAARVLTHGGELLVVEPLAEGDYFELLRPIEDETEIRAAAYRALHHAPMHGFETEREDLYLSHVRQPSFGAMLESFLKANPARREALEGARDRLAAAYDRLGEPDQEGGGRRFVQPFRLILCRRL
jgi:ubiquinone/menaquinone biosynthesis C-methylase UbiE